MSESLFFTCGWPSLPLGGLIVSSTVTGGYALTQALRRSPKRRLLGLGALGVALTPLIAGLVVWGLKHSAARDLGLQELELQGRACAEIGVAGTFFNIWLAIGATSVAFLIPARK